MEQGDAGRGGEALAGVAELRGSVRRRTVLTGVAGSALAVTLGGNGLWLGGHAHLPLFSQTVALRGPSDRVLVGAGERQAVIPGTRVLAGGPRADELVRDEQAWLDSCGRWTREAGSLASLLRSALLDLRVLTVGLEATVAGWTPYWRFVWPRDAAHAAVALALAGRLPEAALNLDFLQRVQGANGGFQARYRPDGSGPPDDRPAQLDGMGWAPWAVHRVAEAVPVPDRLAWQRRYAPLAGLAGAGILEAVERGGLPPASPDYWEVSEDRLTLGTAAPLAAGLAASASVLAAVGDPEAAATRGGASTLATAVRERFGPRGYARYATGGARDAAVTFLLPPYTDRVSAPVVAALDRAITEMGRPGGGLAPGGAWPRDGVSWTPPTALAALALAHTGRRQEAEARLHWLADHRTAAGSLPEKVLYDGRPAFVAPLAWTAALVVMAIHRLVRPPVRR